MSINGFKFFAFCFLCYLVLGVTSFLLKKYPSRQKTAWKLLLSLFSTALFLLIDVRFLFVIGVYSFVLFIVGKKISSKPSPWIQVGVGISVGLLCYFKYMNFFIGSIIALFGGTYDSVSMILPIGISFYTLSGISYLIDVKRSKYLPSKSILDVYLYVTFFGKITAGPLVRYDWFAKEIDRWEGLQKKDLCDGIQLFVIGMFKKMVIADHLGVFVNDVYNSPQSFGSITVIWAVLSYALQIYYDFSGYSDMAIGVSTVFGLHFKKNFNFPYVSQNLTEFWKRWHISLSSWFQEYLYYPLGGNRKGKYRSFLNLFIVMFISGMWHGAAWTFGLWGALHGFGLIVHKIWASTCEKKETRTLRFVSVVGTNLYVAFCWIFFRANGINNAIDIIKAAVCNQAGIIQIYSWTFVAVVLLIGATLIMKKQNRTVENYDSGYPLLNLSTYKGMIAFFVICGLTIGLAYMGNTVFIYEAF